MLHSIRVTGEADMFTASTELQNARMVVNSYSNWTDVFKVTYGIKFALWLQ